MTEVRVVAGRNRDALVDVEGFEEPLESMGDRVRHALAAVEEQAQWADAVTPGFRSALPAVVEVIETETERDLADVPVVPGTRAILRKRGVDGDAAAAHVPEFRVEVLPDVLPAVAEIDEVVGIAHLGAVAVVPANPPLESWSSGRTA